jgi:hypothetical protein
VHQYTDEDYRFPAPALEEVLRNGVAAIDRKKMLEAIGWSNRTGFTVGHPTGQEIVDEVSRIRNELMRLKGVTNV